MSVVLKNSLGGSREEIIKKKKKIPVFVFKDMLASGFCHGLVTESAEREP